MKHTASRLALDQPRYTATRLQTPETSLVRTKKQGTPAESSMAESSHAKEAYESYFLLTEAAFLSCASRWAFVWLGVWGEAAIRQGSGPCHVMSR